MRVKALVLNAPPRAGFKSPRILIGDVPEWRVVPVLTPKDFNLEDEILIVYGYGDITREFSLRTSTIMKDCDWIEASIEKDLKGAESVSIILEEV